MHVRTRVPVLENGSSVELIKLLQDINTKNLQFNGLNLFLT
jgi:hypothetical protein